MNRREFITIASQVLLATTMPVNVLAEKHAYIEDAVPCVTDLLYHGSTETICKLWKVANKKWNDSNKNQTALWRNTRIASQIYSFQTWNYKFLDVDTILGLSKINKLILGEYYKFVADERFRTIALNKAIEIMDNIYNKNSNIIYLKTIANHNYDELKAYRSADIPGDLLPYKNTDYVVSWGDPHIHSILSYDAMGSPYYMYRFAKEIGGLDFIALTDHAFNFGTSKTSVFNLQPDQMGKVIRSAVEVYAKKANINTFYGYEWGGRFAQGHRNILFPPKYDGCETPSVLNNKTNNINKLWGYFEDEKIDCITVPHHTSFASNSMGNAFNYTNNKYDRVIEVISYHGDFEFPDKPLPMSKTGKSVKGRTVSDALLKGNRFGIVGQSDCHTGTPGLNIKNITGCGGRSGYTAVLVKDKNDESQIYDAIKARRCYATDGKKIFLDFRINNNMMGREIYLNPCDELEIFINVHGTDKLSYVQLLCNEIEFAAFRDVREKIFKKTIIKKFETIQNSNRIRCAAKSENTIMIFRLRVKQMDGFRAWSSPIWVGWQV